MKKKLFTISVASIGFLLASALIAGSLHAQTISTIAGTGTSGYTGDGAAATSAQLSNPGSSAVDAAGNVYIADKGNHVIRKIGTDGNISTIAGTGISGDAGDGGAATAAKLNSPLSVRLDASGNILIADFGNSRIRKVNTAGIITTVAGTTAGLSGDGGNATSAQIQNPTDLAVDAAGNIYICDYGNSLIRKVNTSGTITTIAGSTSGFSGDGGPATAAQLDSPNGIFVDASGNVLVADLNNNRVRRVLAAGNIETVAGIDTAGYSGDGGAATAAKLSRPAFVTLDTAGNVYFSDLNNHVVRKITTSGIISTIAGDNAAGPGYSGDGGAPAAAQLRYPTGVTFDALGNFYITTQGSHVLRKIAKPSSTAISTMGNQQNSLGVYPNPAVDGSFMVDVPAGQQKELTIIITDIVGKKVFQTNASGGSRISVKLNVPAGMYMIQAESGQTKYNTRITIK